MCSAQQIILNNSSRFLKNDSWRILRNDSLSTRTKERVTSNISERYIFQYISFIWLFRLKFLFGPFLNICLFHILGFPNMLSSLYKSVLVIQERLLSNSSRGLRSQCQPTIKSAAATNARSAKHSTAPRSMAVFRFPPFSTG